MLLLLVIVSANGCKKTGHIPTNAVEVPLHVEVDDSMKGNPLIINTGGSELMPTKLNADNYVFDWETAQTMPSPSDATRIPVPWADEAVRQYKPDLRFDYKKSDGWELVYNTFTPQGTIYNLVFVLYNKFRGILRFYEYSKVANSFSFPETNSYVNTLELTGRSNVFNFADQYIIDLDKNSSSTSVSDSYSLVPNGWYISQFELAYDPKLAQSTFGDHSVTWRRLFYKQLSGMLNNRKLDANFDVEKGGLNAGTFNSSGPIQLNLRSLKDVQSLTGIFNPESVKGLSRQISGDDRNSNLFHGMLISSSDLINLKVESDGLLSRDAVSVSTGSTRLALPGHDSSQMPGLSPVFNESPGIFYLNGKPEIMLTVTKESLAYKYALNVGSVAYLFNPFISKYADIKNVNQEIVAKDVDDIRSLTETKIYNGQILRSNKRLSIIGVRVSFDVVPKNGSNKIRIIKTFAANVKET
jgi:hypothetical protein